MNRSLSAAGKRAALAALHRLPEDRSERFLLIIDRDEEGIEIDILFRNDVLHIEEL
jgi:hypothetical protein